jgi:hypothetical protein
MLRKPLPLHVVRMLKEFDRAARAKPTYSPEVRRAGGEVPIADQIALMQCLIPLLLLDRFKAVPEPMLEKVRTTASVTRLRWWLTRLETATTLAEMKIGTGRERRRSPARRRAGLVYMSQHAMTR